MKEMLNNIWRYRQFIKSSIRHDLIHRFAASKLGGLWSVLNPLSQVLIYALILSNILHSKLSGIDNKYAYAIYLMAGLLAWSLFSEIITRCLNLFVENGNLLKKMHFPRIVLPIVVTGSCVINNLLLFSVMLIIFLILGHHFSLQMLWLIPLLFYVSLFALGLGLILGIINVFVRDLGQFIQIMLQVWFWFTPIVYPTTIIPKHYQHLLTYNPMYFVVDAYHQALVYNHQPNIRTLPLLILMAFAILAMSLFLFRRASPEMVDVL